MAQAPKHIAAAVDAGKVAQQNPDSLRRLRNMIAAARDQELTKRDLEEKLEKVSANLTELYTKLLPDLMDEVGVKELTLEAEGNEPGVEVSLEPFYAANIAAKWPEEKRKAAFDWLDENGHGDLIKTSVVVTFPREDRKEALKFSKQVKKLGFTHSLEEGVHFKTLTSWLKEQYTNQKKLPPLETFGATVGRVVKLTTKKE